MKKNGITQVLTHCIHLIPTLRFAQYFANFEFNIYFKWVYSGDKIGLIDEWGLKGINEAYCVSILTRDYWLKNGLRSKNTKVIHDGIPISNPILQDASKLPEETLELFFAGRIIPSKGLHLLLEAIQLLPFSTSLTIYGKFPTDTYADHLEDLIDQLVESGRHTVNVKGYSQDASNYFHGYDLGVIPSTSHDAQPLVLLESLLQCTPVTISDQIGIRNLYANYREMVFTSNPESIAGSITFAREMDQSNREEFTKEMLDTVRKKFNITDTHKALLELLHEH